MGGLIGCLESDVVPGSRPQTGGSPFTECDPTAQSIPGSADTGAGRVGWKPYIARHVESKELIDGTNVGR